MASQDKLARRVFEDLARVLRSDTPAYRKRHAQALTQAKALLRLAAQWVEDLDEGVFDPDRDEKLERVTTLLAGEGAKVHRQRVIVRGVMNARAYRRKHPDAAMSTLVAAVRRCVLEFEPQGLDGVEDADIEAAVLGKPREAWAPELNVGRADASLLGLLNIAKVPIEEKTMRAGKARPANRARTLQNYKHNN